MRNLQNVPLAIVAWVCTMMPAFAQGDQFYNPALPITAIYQEGLAAIDSADWAKAAIQLRQVIYADPLRKDAWFNLAFTYYQMGDFLETERHIEKLLSIDPFYEKAHELYGTALYQRGEYERAAGAFNYELSVRPNKELLVKRALCFIAQGNPKYALTDLDEVLYEDPGHIHACLAKGAALIELGQYTYALRFLNRIIENDPENIAALTNRAICHFHLGDQQLSIVDFGNALSIEPWLPTLLARAKCALAAGQFNTAISDVKAAMLLHSNAPEVYFLLGEIEMRQGKYEKAIESFEIALSLDHTCLDCRLLKSEAATYIADFDSAIKDIYTVLEEAPNNDQAREMLLWVYAQMDRKHNVEK